MTGNIHLRKVEDKTIQILKQEASNQDISVNTLVLNLINKGLGISKDREKVVFHDLDKLAGTWNKSQAKLFMKNLVDFEQIDKDLWK